MIIFIYFVTSRNADSEMTNHIRSDMEPADGKSGMNAT